MFCLKHFTKEQFASCWEVSREKYYRLAYCYTKNEHDALKILSEATYKGYPHTAGIPKGMDTTGNQAGKPHRNNRAVKDSINSYSNFIPNVL